MRFLPREQGQGLVEYGLILLFISLAVILILMVFGEEVSQLYTNVVNAL